MRHALDADHVVAVTTIVARERSLRGAARVGASWGLGHSATILAVGGVIVGLRVAIPERVSLAFEFLVALMLIALGVLTLLRSRDDAVATPRAFPPIVIGFVHGLAGTAAVALLALAAVRGPVEGIVYLVVFGLGTIVGMMGVTAAIAAPALFAARRLTAVRRYVRLGAGAASLVVGLVLAHEVGVDRGLFAATAAAQHE
jgi:high-affinity nickel-transport protein